MNTATQRTNTTVLAAHGGTRAATATVRRDRALVDLPGSPEPWRHSAPSSLPAASAHATVLETKLSPPPSASGLVQRAELLEQDAAVVTVCAPTGYGKTTLLSQFAAVAGNPVAWVSLDEADDDPAQLLIEIATAFDRCVPLDPRVFGALLNSEPAIFGEALPRLVNSLARSPDCVLLLDEVHRITSRQCNEVLAYLCEHLPAGARLILASRSQTDLPLGRLRARRMLLELGPRELALNRVQAQQLFEGVCAPVAPQAFDVLFDRTEGWPAGIYLAALAARGASDPERTTLEFDGGDATVTQYLTTELLKAEGDDRLAFLRQTSVLNRISAPLCDAVLERDDSISVLGAMEQANGFVIALDRRREWYRYHHLFRQAMQADLARREPHRRIEILQRAAHWHAAEGHHAEAIEYALAAQDERLAAELLSRHIQTLSSGTDCRTLRCWLDALSDAAFAEHPALALAGVWATLHLGELDKTCRYLRPVERLDFDGPYPRGEVSRESAVALLKATLGWDGVSRIGVQAALVRGVEPHLSPAYRTAGLWLGASLFLQGRTEPARSLLDEAAEVGGSAFETAALAHALLALVELEEHRLTEAEAALARSACDAPQDHLASAPLLAARAWLDVVQGDRASATLHLEQAVRLLPRTTAIPWLTTYLHIVVGRAALELDELALATSLADAARRGLTRYPDAGELAHMLARLDHDLKDARGGAKLLHQPLTQAELRILELAPAYLTVDEIGQTLCVSRNTVKSHLKAIYGKLDVISRSEAVQRAKALRLIS